MSISQKEVEHIAGLARIELTDREKEKYGKELSAILEFVEKLNEVDTRNVEPITGGNLLVDVMRPDEQITKDLEEKSAPLVGAAPDKKENWIKVKAIFE